MHVSKVHPKGLLLDIDGTITNSSREISDATARSIAVLSTTRLCYGVCTGRHFAAIKNYILPHFPNRSLHIVAGGGQIISSNGDVIWERLIPSNEVKTIVNEVEKRGGEIILGHGNGLYCSRGVYQNLLNHPWNISVDHLEDMAPETALISIVQLNPEVCTYIQSLDQYNIKLIGKDPKAQYFDLTVKGVDKAKAARIWCEKQRIHINRVVAVGDNMNDEEMLTAVGYGVAMGNSPQSIQKIAKEVIGDTDANGLAIFLAHLLN